MGDKGVNLARRGLVTSKVRNIAVIAAGAGWVAAAGITIATPLVDKLREYPYLVTRLFLLLIASAAVLTLGLWFEKALLPVVETVYNLGMRAGRRMERVGRRDGTLRDASSDGSGSVPWRAQPGGQEDTPPSGWRAG